MPVKINPELARLAAHVKAPEGYFSVLDELIGQLPKNRSISVEELRQRLKPNAMLKREGMLFPLKQEELDYAFPQLGEWDPEFRIPDSEHLQNFVRKNRPSFNAATGADSYSAYATTGPNKLANVHGSPAYFENLTRSPDFDRYRTHFGDNVLAFSRGTRHNMPEGLGVLRLIDEIQNDRANDARGLVPLTHEAEPRPRGWATPEETTAPGTIPGVPDAPFKDPAAYGRLEIKNQLLAALEADDAALGITPSSGPASWFPGTGAKGTTYDKVYPGELRKLASQYGAEFRDIDLPVTSSGPLNLPSLQGTDIVDFIGNFDWDRREPLIASATLLDDIERAVRPAPGSQVERSIARARGKLDQVQKWQDALTEAPSRDALKSYQTAQIELEDALRDAYADTNTPMQSTQRRIPSMMLTPEVKERVARIGLPLFMGAGAAAMSPETMDAFSDEDEAPAQAFAGGGVVRKATGLLRRLQGASGTEARAQEAAWRRALAEEMAQNAPRGPVGARKPGVQAYTGYNEKRPTDAVRAPDEGALRKFGRYLTAYAAGGPVGWSGPHMNGNLAQLAQYIPQGGNENMPQAYGWMPQQAPQAQGPQQPNMLQDIGKDVASDVIGDAAQRGVSKLGSALGIGAAGGTGISGNVIGSLGSWGGTAGAGTLGSLTGGGMAAMNNASPLGQLTLGNLNNAAKVGGTAATGLKGITSASNLANLAGGIGGAIVGKQLANSKEGAIGSAVGSLAGTALAGGSGVALGAQLGMAAGPVGAIVGAALGAVLGNVFGNEAKNTGVVKDAANGIIEFQKAKKIKDPTTGRVLSPEELAKAYQPAFAAYAKSGSIMDAKQALQSSGNPALDAELANNWEKLWKGRGDIIDAIDTAVGRDTYAKRKGKKADRAKGMGKKGAVTVAGSAEPGASAGAAAATRIPDLQALRKNALTEYESAPTQLSRVQPTGPRITPGANKTGLLSRIQQQQAARGP